MNHRNNFFLSQFLTPILDNGQSKKILIILFLLSGLCGFSQSAKKENLVLKEQMIVAKKSYDADVSVFLADFKSLEKARNDYRSKSKADYLRYQTILNKFIDSVHKIVLFFEDFEIDYSELLNEEDLKKSEGLFYRISTEPERIMLSRILVFQNVKDTLVLEGLKPKVQNVLLKNQLDLYRKAEIQNTAVLEEQRQLISTVKKSSQELDSMAEVYRESSNALNNSLVELSLFAFDLYMKDKKRQGATRYTDRYDREFRKGMPSESRKHLKSLEMPIAEIPAKFPGGSAVCEQYLKDQIQSFMREDESYGSCYVQFIVKTTGEISDAFVLKGIPECPECSREALRIVKEMPNWIPGKTSGKEVDSKAVLSINFSLK